MTGNAGLNTFKGLKMDYPNAQKPLMLAQKHHVHSIAVLIPAHHLKTNLWEVFFQVSITWIFSASQQTWKHIVNYQSYL